MEKEEPADEEKLSASSAATAASPKKNIGGGARAADDGGDAFDRFWAVYPKPVDKLAARKAWDRQINDGVDPETLIARAKLYAIERQGEPSRYTKNPATWLNAGSWDNPLPGAPILDQEGNVVAVEQPPPKHSGPKTWDDVVREFNAEMEARDGHVH